MALLFRFLSDQCDVCHYLSCLHTDQLNEQRSCSHKIIKDHHLRLLALRYKLRSVLVSLQLLHQYVAQTKQSINLSVFYISQQSMFQAFAQEP